MPLFLIRAGHRSRSRSHFRLSENAPGTILFFRYDYRRVHEKLAVVTTLGATGDGVVHSSGSQRSRGALHWLPHSTNCLKHWCFYQVIVL
jgi:hypothetical protein